MIAQGVLRVQCRLVKDTYVTCHRLMCYVKRVCAAFIVSYK